MNDNLYKQTIAEFEKKRMRQDLFLAQRQSEIYANLRKIKEIDYELNTLGLQLTKMLISKDTDKKAIVTKFENKTSQLNEEKIKILKLNGYESNYLQIQYDCSKCNDTGFINATICTCFTKALISKYYQQSNLQKILDIENFDNFRLDYYDINSDKYSVSPNLKMQNIYSKAVQFVEKFDSANDNLYLLGNPGLGKTYLSHCIAKDLLDKGYSVIYQTSTDLIDAIRNSKFNQSNGALMIECLYDCDLLIIDDLGTENLTEFANNELFNLINKRLKDMKKHVISTNLSLKELENRYNSRLYSRIMGNFTFLKFIGEDIRLKKANII